MQLERNGVDMERHEVSYKGKAYRVTATPSLIVDQHPMVEVWIPECGYRYSQKDFEEIRHRYGHWRRLKSGPTKTNVAFHARHRAQALNPAIHNTIDEDWERKSYHA